ncbi:hypothetical protein AB0K60_05505 [Thermopolyspora sp. NPDC052614]|uniref:hypothetical protein n=1 Tax=Thermopolyspora sp. NPDC052614 TaxID=3155682 RepID=UPI003431C9D1
MLVGTVAGVAIFDSPPEVRGADVDPVELLAEMDDLPKVSFIRVAEKKGAASRDPYWGAESSAARGWGVRHDYYLFDERVLKFSDEASAKAEFQMAPYGRVFNDSIYLDIVRPVNLTAEGLRADSASLGCMDWYDEREPSCFAWAFYGRYGRYLVEITFSSDRDPDFKRGLRQDDFLMVVKGVDRRIAGLGIN